MFSVNLSTREGDGHVVVALRGELDVADAVSVAAALAAVAARDLEIIVDLAGLDSLTPAAWQRWHTAASMPAARGVTWC